MCIHLLFIPVKLGALKYDALSNLSSVSMAGK